MTDPIIVNPNTMLHQTGGGRGLIPDRGGCNLLFSINSIPHQHFIMIVDAKILQA
jgi:hypothetical protein